MGKEIRAHEQSKKIAKTQLAPARGVFQDYYRPAYENAYQAADNMGGVPSFYSQYAGAKRQQDAQFNRMGMGQSGAAMASRGGLERDFANARFGAQQQANQNQFDAYSGLANQAYQGGMGAYGGLADAQNRYTGYLGAKEAQENAERAQSRATEKAGVGQAIGGIADIGLAIASGGASIPMQGATGGFSSLFGGAGDAATREYQYQTGTQNYGDRAWDNYTFGQGGRYDDPK